MQHQTQSPKEKVTMKQAFNDAKNGKKSRLQYGFTLVELIIVIGVIGGIMAIILPSISSPNTKTDALLIERVATSAKSNFDLLALSCGTSRRAATPLAGDDATKVPSLIFEGVVEANYTDCYASAGVSPLSRDVSRNDDGEYRVNDSYPISFEGGGHVPLEIAFKEVPAEVAESIALGYNRDFDISSSAKGGGSVYGDGVIETTPLTVEPETNDFYTVTYRYVN